MSAPAAVDPVPGRWAAALPRPRAFVCSGGASLGSMQVGMLRALGEAQIGPDLLVGTSVGALNAAVTAHLGLVPAAVTRLETIWRGLRRREVFPGSVAAQIVHAARTGYLHPASGLETLIRRSLGARRFEELALPLTVIASEVLTGHVRRLSTGQLVPALLAATALPGMFPPVTVDGSPLWDGGSVANVPLRAALDAGARSIVVLDVGDVCHLDELPRGFPDGLVLAMSTAMRQRVLVEAPLVAEEVPLVYLPRPCTRNRSLLDLDSSAELIEPAYELAAAFLADAAVPVAGQMAGGPHAHHR
ncbi:MAG: patatin-like phospholipase family protein [Nitriliruptoraceae bacterium]